MTVYQLRYGKTLQSLSITDSFQADWIEPPFIKGLEDPLPLLKQALDSPLQTPRIEDLLATAQTVAIAINDKTRPVPHHFILPPLLNRLHKIPKHKICFWIATGTHLPMSDTEFPLILPSWIIEQYPVVSHNIDNASNFIFLGSTQQIGRASCRERV